MGSKEGENYTQLDHEAYGSSHSFADEENHELLSGYPRGITRRKSIWMNRLMPALMLFSIGLNVLQIIYASVHRPKSTSLYAKLPEHEKNMTFWYSTEFSEGPEEEKEALWSTIDISEGFVAISNDEADALGLPRSAPFPWDVNKGLYLSHAHHALHCVTLLHAYIRDAHHKRVPLVSYHHTEHCLDLLRQDIKCNADDNMDYQPGHGDEFLLGDGQHRKCRDWSKYTAWLRERSACYKSINVTYTGEDHGVEQELSRYTYCPEGSPYIPMVEVYKDLARKNPGNLDPEATALSSEDGQHADAEAVAKHNADVVIGDPIESTW